jgi:hypothetical protein
VLGVVEVLDRATAGDNTGRDLDVLGLVSSQLAAVVQLSAAYDSVGSVLVAGLAGAETESDFATALAALATTDSTDRDLAALAATFSRLAALGPGNLRMATSILDAVVTNATTKGRE